MKYLLHTFYLLTTLFFITSCGVDRSGEYYALVGDDMWIEEVMKQHYLWYDQIPEISEKDYFAEPEEFLQKLLYTKALDGKGDPFSYVEMKANVSRSFLNQTSTYGFDFELVTDPLGTSHLFLRNNIYFAELFQLHNTFPLADIDILHILRGTKQGSYANIIFIITIPHQHASRLYIIGGKCILYILHTDTRHGQFIFIRNNLQKPSGHSGYIRHSHFG